MKDAFDAVLQAARDEATFNNTTLRFGEVVKAGNHLVTVRLADTDVHDIPFMRGTNPSPGDWAWLLHQGSLMVCIGVSAGPHTSSP